MHVVEGVGVEACRSPRRRTACRAAVPPASCGPMTSASPSARARETTNVSPPDRVAGSRSSPDQSSRTRRLSPPRFSPAPAPAGVLEAVALVAHRGQPLVGRVHDLGEPVGEDVGGQPHLQPVVRCLALDEGGQPGGQLEVLADRTPGPQRREQLGVQPRQPVGAGLADPGLGAGVARGLAPAGGDGRERVEVRWVAGGGLRRARGRRTPCGRPGARPRASRTSSESRVTSAGPSRAARTAAASGKPASASAAVMASRGARGLGAGPVGLLAGGERLVAHRREVGQVGSPAWPGRGPRCPHSAACTSAAMAASSDRCAVSAATTPGARGGPRPGAG